MCDSKNLKPCPFCGEMPHLEEDYEFAIFSVYCDNIECVTKPFTDAFETASEAIKVWNTRVNNYEIMCKKIAAHTRQLIDDIEKADSDYFKMKKYRDGWKAAFYEAVKEFKKLSKICDRLITAREMLTEEVNDLKAELKSMDYDFSDSRDRYENDIDALVDENEKLKNALESTEKELNDYQETCETLTKENERLRKMCRLCGSY